MKVLRNALFATGTLAVLIAALVAVSPQSPHPSATHPDYSGTKAEAAASSALLRTVHGRPSDSPCGAGCRSFER